MKSIFAIILSFCFVYPCYAGIKVEKYAEIVSALQNRLANDCSRRDSITVLSNLFDIYQTYKPASSDSVAALIYEVALREEDHATALEMLRMRANASSSNIERLNELLKMAESFPKDSHPEETITFIEMQRNYYYATRADLETRKLRFQDQLRELTIDSPEDIYEHIKLLHAVCVNIANESNGELLSRYLLELGDLIDQLPASDKVLRNIYYVQSALAYSNVGEHLKAIEADKKLLDIMDSLERHYTSIGRPYRNYGANRYIVYTRLLSQWKQLTPKQIEDYYLLALKYRDEHPRAQATYNQRPMPEIYYAMANKHYEEVMPMLVKQVDNPANKPIRNILLKYLIEASTQTGDTATTLKASMEYNKELENMLDSRVQEKLKELQIRYDTYKIKDDYDRLQIDKRESENRLQKMIIMIAVIALLGLLLLVFFLVRLYRHSKKLADTLAVSNQSLKSESESLRASQKELTEARDAAQRANQFKSDFIKNMSHEVSVPLNALIEYSHLIVDCADASNKPYLERYAEQVELNGEFLTAIVNDVLHLSEIDSESVSLHRQLVDLRKITELSVESISSRIGPDVKVIFDPESPNLDTFTDPRRVQQILVSVLGNAAKFTRKGVIFLECHPVNNGNDIAIAISDTGIGIPSGQEEHIFERFVKLNPDTQGLGLGLPISRLLARLLGGDLVLDTTYTRGARFILTLPYQVK